MTALVSGRSTARIESPFLEGLRPAEMEAILAAAGQRTFRAGTVITRQGMPAKYFFLLVEGRARYFVDTAKGQKLLMMWIVPGGVIGGGAVTQKLESYVASTEAVRDSTVLCWDRMTIRKFATRYPRLLDNGLTIAVEYMSWSIETLVGLTSHTAPERLAHVLLKLAHLLGSSVPGGVEVDVTNEELASAANITPYTTSRLLSRWQRGGIVQKQRGKIVVRSTDKLGMQLG